jgi:hypothetical protein
MRTSGITLVLLSLFMLACDQPPTGPAGEGAPNPATSKGAEITGQLVIGGKASGHVAVQGTPVQNIRDQRYSFTAIADGAFPSAKGQVVVHSMRFTGEEITVHAEVTCLSIVGDQAWVGSRVTRYVSDGDEVSDRIGLPMVFTVVDQGEGENGTEQASLVFFYFPPEGQDFEHCTTHPEIPILRLSTTGNIQITGE